MVLKHILYLYWVITDRICPRSICPILGTWGGVVSYWTTWSWAELWYVCGQVVLIRLGQSSPLEL